MQKALIIGASSDIGLELTKLLLKKKYNIYCTYNKNPDNLKSLKKKNPNNIEVIKLDLHTISEVRKFIKVFKKKTNQVNLIILGANIKFHRRRFSLVSMKSFKKKILGNILSNTFLIQFLILYFLKKNKIKLIHVSSLASLKGSWGLSEYSSSKAAIDNILKCLKFEFKKLHVKSIYLGAVKTRGYFFANKIRKKKIKFISAFQAAKKILVGI